MNSESNAVLQSTTHQNVYSYDYSQSPLSFRSHLENGKFNIASYAQL